jgi:ATP-dependent RNA helicase RhlE
LITKFSELPLSAYVQERLKHNGFVTPTPVQAAAIPVAFEGDDILATAQTGTGKTLAFMIPIIEMMLEEDHHAKGAKPTHEIIEALVLVPTRELAMQVVGEYDKLRGKKLPPAALIVGGIAEKPQLKALKDGARLIVATPGRLEDLMDRGFVKFKGLNILVLDEADRMLDMGFIPAIRRIMKALPGKDDKQTMCFSATLEASVVHLIDQYLQKPVRLEFGSTLKPIDSVQLRAYEVSNEQKLSLLEKLLTEDGGRFMIFTRTKRGAERLTKKLVRDKYHAAMIHGDRSQSQRNAALAGFQQGRYQILVATDVASRGIHVEDVAHVVNYDLPAIPEDFIHRIGRTGRAGGSGIASTFVSGVDVPDFKIIERTLKLNIQRMNVDGNLAKEEKPGPVKVTGKMQQASRGSKMMRLPGEVLQRHGDRSDF